MNFDFVKNKRFIVWGSISLGAIIVLIVGTVLVIRAADNKNKQAADNNIVTPESSSSISSKESSASSVASLLSSSSSSSSIKSSSSKSSSTSSNVKSSSQAISPSSSVNSELIIVAKYYSNGLELNKESGVWAGYYGVDVLGDRGHITLNYTEIANTTPTVTIEKLDGTADRLVKYSDFDYYIPEGWIDEIIFRIDLKDSNGNIVKTGKCKLVCLRG